MTEAFLLTELAAVEALTAEWDGLAVACRAPLSTPAWMLAWWRHVATSELQMRLIVVRADGRVIGIVPLYAESLARSRVVRYGLLADSFASAVQPLALPGREYEVAWAAAPLIEGAEPHPDRLDLGPMPAFSPWARAMSEGWPGPIRPLSMRSRVEIVPTVSVHNRTFDQWLLERDSRVRANSRRRQRRFTNHHGSYRHATADSLSNDLRTYVGLHASRWQGRGESRFLALGDQLIPFFEHVARPLIDAGRFRLLMVELEGQPICAEISVVAGGEVASLTAGWDEEYRALGPARLALLHSIQDACQRRERRIDLGWGNVEDKQQYTDATDAVSWDSLVIPGGRLLRTLSAAAPGIAARAMRKSAKRMLSEPQLNRLRALRAGDSP